MGSGSHTLDLETLDARTLEDQTLFHNGKGRPVAFSPLPVPVADTHGHLTSLHGHDSAWALARCAIAGVAILVVPVDPVGEFPSRFADAAGFLSWLDETTERAQELLATWSELGLVAPSFEGYDVPSFGDGLRFVVGAHPYGAPELGSIELATLEALLGEKRCVGVGEIGLDFGPYSEVPEDVQLAAFSRQLAIAREANVPVELHIRDGADNTRAHDLAADLLAREGLPAAGCDLHCFTQGPEVMAPFVELGCHVAFGGAATFGRSDDIRAAAAACPEHLLLSETDAPYMAPVPLRGQECEPAMVELTASLLAQVREGAGVAPRTQTLEALWRNARTLFGI